MFNQQVPVADKFKDKRFKHPEWTKNAVFNFVKESYLVAPNRFFRAFAKSRVWTRVQPARSTFIRASSSMPCPVCAENLNPNVAVMKSAQEGV
jgi:hypothetical protein